MIRPGRLLAAIALSALFLVSPRLAGAQVPPIQPTPTPVPQEQAKEPAASEASEASGQRESTEGSSSEDESPPKEEVETNPGEVAFTDYQPFDLERIEYEPVESKWKNFVAGVRGLTRYSLFDGKVKFRIGGKTQLDGTAGTGNDKFDRFYSPLESDFSVRRLEAFAAGRILDFNFNLAFEFGADWGFNDAWIEGAKGGLEVWGHFLGKLRIGLMNEPFSLERQTSSYNIGFMERSLPVQTIAPGMNVGAMVHDSGKRGRFTWAAGIFSIGKGNDNNASTSVLSLTGRATSLLAYRNEGRDLIHIGASVSLRSPTGGETRYRSRPEARFIDYLADTGNMEAGNIRLWGLEFATVRGPLWCQGEFIRSDVNAQLLDDPVFKGSYVQVGWFLTGESKPYRTNSGTFDRLRPRKKYTKGNPFKKRNGGAWELAGRLSTIDLNGGLVDGGKITDISGALSWYVNATTRIELNYVHTSPKNRGVANVFLLRVQFQPW